MAVLFPFLSKPWPCIKPDCTSVWISSPAPAKRVPSNSVTLLHALAPGKSSWVDRYLEKVACLPGQFLSLRGNWSLCALPRFKGFSVQKCPERVKLGKFIRLVQSHTVEGSSAGSPARCISLSVGVQPWFQREQASLTWQDLYGFQLLI